jgi:hypothetical protein
VNNPTIWGGIVALLIAYIAYLQAGRVADRNALAQLEVKRLEGEHQRDGWRHDDYVKLMADWRTCVEARANCEAERSALIRENADLLKERTSLAEQVSHLDFENRELKQKVVASEFFDEVGRTNPRKLKEFADTLMQNEMRELPPGECDSDPE